jgi:flagellar biosynthesis chaperone FliJ
MADLERSQEQSRREMEAMDELADLRYVLSY